MTVDEIVTLIGVGSAPFLVFMFLMYKVGKKISMSAICFECGNTHWEWESEYVEEEENVTQHVLFKCADCGHVRGRYIGRVEKKEK